MPDSRKTKKNLIIIVSVLIIALIVFIIFTFLNKWHSSQIVNTKEAENAKFQQVLGKLEKDIVELKSEIKLQKETILPSEEIKAVFGETNPKKIDCKELKKNIMVFFSYLDQKGYNISQGDKGCYGLYMDSLSKLKKNPPVLSNDSAGTLTLLRSMSHFYRIFGKRDLKTIRQIIENESAMLEPAMVVFYDWFTNAKECKASPEDIPSIETLYNYSCFFLNTIAGKSYLLRRSSKIRILASYYCILIIDKANDETLNQYGYDIRANIVLLYDDIKNHQKLLYKKIYLEKLNDISKKYPEL